MAFIDTQHLHSTISATDSFITLAISVTTTFPNKNK